ncbi:polysaccharide biosynthesis tyrosine autokinase [Clostridium sp. MSJ-8]|uniref:polysaccharide biosynthesis tyrosine autokinase n=1 Tax=Clostridium sp. MSJ-8 TaxID=2841510 RepID=UPI001C0F05A1|nr:polysaccharide biosynthesis tyrosine autokinase [Clostridium sp. MSJ-8]MBU5487096.1 polysaccharide biosynthesis tyrosine autokinase [Clostridium sp. MSJ-8]
MNENYIGVKDILMAIRKKWILITIITICVTGLFGIYSYKVSKPVYQGSSKVIIGKINTDDLSISSTDITLFTSLKDTYQEYIKSTSFMKEALDFKDLDMDPRKVLSGLSITSSETSTTMTISYSGNNVKDVCNVLDAVTEYVCYSCTDIISNAKISVLEEPYVSTIPVSPNHKKDLVIGFLGGLIISVGLTIILELTNGKIRTEEDLTSVTSYPVLGNLYKIDRNSDPLVVLNNPNSIQAEGYRGLRTSIEYSSFDNKIKTLLITSSQPSEGKSVTTANLALAYARAEKKTLIIDCDLRKPTQHKKFSIINNIGLSDVLVGNKALVLAIQSIDENLDILPAGSVVPNPAELVSSQAMTNLIDKLKAQYDFIVIDSPPALVVSDAQTLATKVDGVVIVAKANFSKKNSMRNAKKSLELVNANIIGTVLNFKDKVKGYYGHYYGKNRKKD